MEFKDILLEYLQNNSMTQSQFAQKIGVKQSQVSEWLKGKAKPGYDTMRSILLNCDMQSEFWFDIND